MNRLELKQASLQLLKQLISVESLSRQEQASARLIGAFFDTYGLPFERVGHNLICRAKHFDATKPTLLLNSHHDTVKPNAGYTINPFEPLEQDGKLYGLGSNDAGGCLAALLATFLHYYDAHLPYNLLFVASAEEEISGANGIELALAHAGPIDCGLVGEPTQMQMAVAERGLMVLDAVATGKAGHAARSEGENALYIAQDDIATIRQFAFEKISPLLGPTALSVTVVHTPNTQHNVVPDLCQFVVDVRVNELYTFEEILTQLQPVLRSTITPRSLRLRSTSIALDHPLVRAGLALGKTYYGSPTTSDKALMPFATLKIGPGHSMRSHSANEYIYIEELFDGIDDYISLIEQL
jgi:acetylornithine deacetylase